MSSGAIHEVNGIVSARWNKLTEVKVQIFTAAGRHITTAKIPATSNVCEISDVVMDLTQLPAGNYRYKITVGYGGYYAAQSQVIANYSDEIVLVDTAFTLTHPDATPGETPSTERDPYLNKCTVYASHCKVVVNKDTTLNSLPSSTEFNGSQAVQEVKAGQVLTAQSLYRNTGGTYWYEILLPSGETAFLSSAHSSYNESVNTDIAVFDKSVPSFLLLGKSFQISGMVQSSNNRLDTIYVQIHTADGNQVASAAVHSANNRCDLSEAELDFSALATGNYWYKIVAKYSGHYANSSQEIGEYSSEVTLLETTFIVTDGVNMPEENPGSTQDPYLDKCMVYSAYCKVKVTASTPLNTLPSSVEYNGSQTILRAEAGQIFTAVALYRNTGGNYWYQVVLDSGEVAYLYSGSAKYDSTLTNDFAVSDKSVPGVMFQGDSFMMSGIVTAQKNRLDEVELRIFDEKGVLVNSIMFLALGNECDLSNVTLDLSALAVGGYTYQLRAKGFGYYATAPQEIAEYECQRILLEAVFVVADEETTPETNLRPELNSYLGKCTYYPVYCKVTTTQSTPLNSLPSSTEFNDSQNVATAAAGQVYTAVALYRNTGGGFWYEVLLENGETAFLSAGYAKFVESLDADITISDTAVPSTVLLGGSFLVCGTVNALRNCLDEVEVQIYSSDGMLVKSALRYGVDGKCDLSTVSLDFAGLSSGSYLYVIMAKYTGNYAVSATESTSYTGHVLLLEAPFEVDVCHHEHHNSAGYCTGCGLTVSHSFENGICDTCGAVNATIPTLTLSYPSLSFEAQIQYNIYYSVTNGEHIMEMGLVTFDSKVADGTIANAKDIVSGFVSDGSTYMVHTNGIPAKNLSDALYFRVYARLLDGSYVYSDLAGYHAVAYVKTVLSSANSTMEARALMVAMLNYGAAAQEYFGYKTDALMNGFLTDAGKKLVAEYDESMVDSVVVADNAKAGHFVMNKVAFTSLYPTVSFEGAFAINYYLVNGLTPDKGISLYYWDVATYESVGLLLTSNATGALQMVQDGDRWYAAVEGIAAKDMDKTIYIAAVYKSDGATCTTSVIPYSLGKYCETIAAQGNAFGAATAVYGFYAKAYFS